MHFISYFIFCSLAYVLVLWSKSMVHFQICSSTLYALFWVIVIVAFLSLLVFSFSVLTHFASHPVCLKFTCCIFIYRHCKEAYFKDISFQQNTYILICILAQMEHSYKCCLASFSNNTLPVIFWSACSLTFVLIWLTINILLFSQLQTF